MILFVVLKQRIRYQILDSYMSDSIHLIRESDLLQCSIAASAQILLPQPRAGGRRYIDGPTRIRMSGEASGSEPC